MKTILSALYCVLACCRTICADFQNLGFEAANTNNVPGVIGTPEDLIPHWQLSLGPTAVTYLGLNYFPLSQGYHTLANTSGRTFVFSISVYPIQGNYALFVSPPIPHAGESFIPYSLTQSGVIPATADKIEFLNFGAPVQLLINGMPLPLTYTYINPSPLDEAFRSALVIGDISSYAGRDVELRFTTIRSTQSGYIYGLDDIRFTSVPEPGTFALLAFGGLMLGWRTVQQRRRR